MTFQVGDRVRTMRSTEIKGTVTKARDDIIKVRCDCHNLESWYRAAEWQLEPPPYSPAWLEQRALAALFARE